SLQLRFCLDQFRFSQDLWRSKDTRRRPSDGLLYGNEFALHGSMAKRPRHIVRVACLIKANMPQRVTRVPEVYEHEAAFCHGVLSHCCADGALLGHGGDDAMHTVDYLVIGFLIACMLLAAAKSLPRLNS